MISRNGKGNFLATHYDWLVCGVGVLACLGGAAFFALSLGDDPDEAASVSVSAIERLKPSKTGVKSLDMEKMRAAVRMTRNPPQMSEVSATAESFLASERRVLCKGKKKDGSDCKAVIPGDVKVCPVCPVCQTKQEEPQKIVLDADGDGMPDEWEKKFGLNPNDPSDAGADKDKDAFTNLEEYQAKTDPTDAKDHPDYLDSLKLQLPLQSTFMPFVFTKATQIPSGWRCEFFDAKQKDDYGRPGRAFTAVIGEKIGKTGYTFKSYEKKEAKREIKGAQGLMRTVDVSEVVVKRDADGKEITLVLSSKKAKPVPVDMQATLLYERGTAQTFEVVTGSEIVLSGTKYKVLSVEAAGKGAKVTIAEAARLTRKRVLQALEP